MTVKRVFRRGRADRAATVDMAPLVDMVFILLIFFMLSTTFVQDTGVDISRPASTFATSLDEGFVPVAIDEQGLVHIAGRTIAPDSIRDIQTALQESKRRRVLVQADRSVPTELLLKVLDTCKLAGATQVDVAAIKGRI